MAVVLVLRRDGRRQWACGLLFLLGTLRYLLALPHFAPEHLAYYNDRGLVEVRGVVAREPDERDTYTNLTVRAEELFIEGRRIAVKGTLLLRIPRLPAYSYGDRIAAYGFLRTPPEWEDFSYRDYLARKGVFSTMRPKRIELLERGQGNPFWSALYALKERAHQVITACVPEPEASLLSGILLGLEWGIPKPLMEAFRRTGTSHIIAISGFNIAILVGFLNGLLKRLLGRRAWPFVLAGIAVYTLLVGADAAVVRAAIMGGLYVIAWQLGRVTYAFISLAFSALVMSAVNPFILWDVGFQLSFAATLGLILFVPWGESKVRSFLEARLPPRLFKGVFNFVNEAVVVTLAAQLATLPLIVYYFHNLSLIGPLANFLVLPAQPGVMLWGGAMTLLGLLWLPLGRVPGWVAWLYTTYTIRCVDFLARPWWASVPMKGWKPEFTFLYYGLLGALMLANSERRLQLKTVLNLVRERFRFGLAASWLAVIAVLVWTAALAQPDGRLHVIFCDVGEGDGIFIRSPQGHEIVIDGGPSPSRFLDCVGKKTPFWDRSIDVVIISHPDEDHIAGLVPLLERYEVGAIIEPGIIDPTPSYSRLLELARDKEITRYEGRRGMSINLSDGVSLYVLNPTDKGTCGDDNNCSVVVRLVAGKASFLFTGDAEEEAEAEMLRSGLGLQSTVLKVAHHGSKSSTTPRFLAAVKPQVAVISVGAGNRFGHPAPEVLERLGNVRLFRTDYDGTVEIITDGERLWVK